MTIDTVQSLDRVATILGSADVAALSGLTQDTLRWHERAGHYRALIAAGLDCDRQPVTADVATRRSRTDFETSAASMASERGATSA